MRKHNNPKYIGSKINNWTVLSVGLKDPNGVRSEVYWLVRCSCGREGKRRADHILSGMSKQCVHCRGVVAGTATAKVYENRLIGKDMDEKRSKAIKKAIKLLEDNGYTVLAK